MKKNNAAGYLFIAPISVLFLIFIVYPIAFNIYISFYSWNGVRPNKTFVGFANYTKLFADPVLLKIVVNFLIFGTLTIVIQAALGLLFASFFRRNIRLSGFYRTVIYLPVIATPTIVGNIFSKILETNRGFLNEFLRAVGLGSWCQQWLADPRWALLMVVMVNIWQWTGYSMLMYYTNMLNIPEDLYEAATIDGANQFQQFSKITFPLLRSTHFTLFVMGALGALKCFDIPFVLTKGGPDYATEFFSTYIYKKSFELFDQGAASCVTMVMFVFAVAITVIQMKTYYRGGKDKELSSI